MTRFVGHGDRAWALFSDDGSHRYALGRDWSGMFDKAPRTLLSCGLNPSIAGVKDDQTITKDRGFAQRFGCSRLVKVNLYSWILTDSKQLSEVPRGRLLDAETDAQIRAQVVKLDPRRTVVLVAWGGHELATSERIAAVTALLPRPLMCLGTTESGQPRHPARIAYDTGLEEWKGPR